VTDYKAKAVVGFDLGGTNCKTWFDNEEVIISEDDLSKANEQILLELIKKWMRYKEDVVAVGIALSCTLVPEQKDRRILPTSTKFARLAYGAHRGVIGAIEAAWSKELGASVSFLNDGEAAAIDVFVRFKKRLGAEDYGNMVIVTLGTSIGVGFIFNGRPYIGPYASRASHILLDPAGVWCANEGHRGCWKTLVGDQARTDLAFNMGLTTDKTKMVDVKYLADKARDDSKRAQLFFKILAENIAKGIATIVNIVPVQCVVISGGIGKAGEILMEPLRERLSRGDLIDPDLAPRLNIIQDDSHSVAHGAQIYAAQKGDGIFCE
jgi:predicted NBD/HSP70 family sugar kinase